MSGLPFSPFSYLTVLGITNVWFVCTFFLKWNVVGLNLPDWTFLKSLLKNFRQLFAIKAGFYTLVSKTLGVARCLPMYEHMLNFSDGLRGLCRGGL